MTTIAAFFKVRLENLLILVLLFFFTGCSQEEEPDPSHSLLEVSQSSITAEQAAGSLEVFIKTALDWEIVAQDDWVLATPSRGKGNESVTIRWGENNTDLSRETKLTILTSRNDLTLRILQKGKALELVDFTGNLETGNISDAKYLLFSKPVQVKRFSVNGESINTESLQRFDNNEGILLSGGFDVVASAYQIVFTVEDEDKNSITDTLAFTNYYHKIVVPGEIVQHFEHEGWLWVVTANSTSTKAANKISVFSSESFELSHEISLPNRPLEASINPLNGNLYVLYSDSERIDIFNQSGNKLEDLIFDNADFDIPGKPVIQPISIGFTKSGRGIILFTANGNEQFVWKYIDSANGHKISSAEKSTNKYNSAKFKKVIANYDHSQLFLQESGLYSSQKIVDDNGTFTELGFTSGSLAPVIFETVVPHKKLNCLFICGSYKQFVYDLDNAKGSKHFTSSHSVGADFTYLEGKEMVVYSIDKMNSELLITDYSTSKVLLKAPVYEPYIDFGAHIDFFTVQNGDYFVMSTSLMDDGVNSAIIVCNKEMFFK